MKTYSKGSHSKGALLTLVVALGAFFSFNPAAVLAADPGGAGSLGLCASVPSPMPLPARALGEPNRLAAAVVEVRRESLPALLGALGQMIVEAELSQAPVSGRFEPVINTALAGSVFALEVCRDSIAGEVSVADRPSLRFVIGDFNDDGATDVALLHPDSGDWSVDLGVSEREAAGTAPRALPGGSAQPGARSQTLGRIARLAGGLRQRGGVAVAG